MKKTCLTSILVLFSLVAMAQGGLDVYLSPFDFPIVFSGNFGEIRANHFHGGLDFKTQGATGKPIKAQADGFISRIRVNSGSGYVLNVTYDNGFYLIYRHLSKFIPIIDERVKQWQYEHEQWEVDIIPEEGEYLAKELEEVFDVPYIASEAPIGFRGTKNFLLKLAAFLGIEDKL